MRKCFVHRVGVQRFPFGLNDDANGQMEFARKFKVALVVRGNCHDGARAIAHHDIVGNPNRNLFAVDGIRRIGAGKDAGFFFAFFGAFDIGFGFGFFDILIHVRFVLGRRQLFDIGMLGRQDHEGRTPQRIGTRGKDAQRTGIGLKIHFGADARPIQLRCINLIWSGQSMVSKSLIKRSL